MVASKHSFDQQHSFGSTSEKNHKTYTPTLNQHPDKQAALILLWCVFNLLVVFGTWQHRMLVQCNYSVYVLWFFFEVLNFYYAVGQKAVF